MAIEPLPFAIDERIDEAGETLPFVGHLDVDGYFLGDHSFELPAGLDYDLVLTNTGEGILATGLVRAHVVGTCDRCLERAEFDVAGEVDGYYLFEEPEQLPLVELPPRIGLQVGAVTPRTAVRTARKVQGEGHLVGHLGEHHIEIVIAYHLPQAFGASALSAACGAWA